MYISEKFKSISPSPTLSIDAKFKQMKADGMDVVGFGAGEPDFDTPEHIKEAAITAINQGFTKYTPASGTVALKQAVVRKLKRDNGLDYTTDQIIISNGAKHSLVNVFGAILNPGDEVIIPAPYWVSYPEMVKINDGVPVVLPTKEENNFKFTAKDLISVITPNTRAFILNSPSNPTGMVYTVEELREIAQVAVEYNLYIISDEIYEHLIYGKTKHVSIASFGEAVKNLTIIINGVSKTYSMTGWRIGYLAAPVEIAKAIANVQSHATSNPNSIAQVAAAVALDGPVDDLLKMKEAFKQRRDYMVERINGMEGVSCLMPDGAFYVMMNIEKLIGREIGGKVIENSDDFAEVFLKERLVAVVPGTGFAAPYHVRWSYATSMENIKEGLDRLESLLKDN